MLCHSQPPASLCLSHSSLSKRLRITVSSVCSCPTFCHRYTREIQSHSVYEYMHESDCVGVSSCAYLTVDSGILTHSPTRLWIQEGTFFRSTLGHGHRTKIKPTVIV